MESVMMEPKVMGSAQERMPERWTVEIGEAVLGRNAELAMVNRQRFQKAGLRVVNIVSSPGSGKTALLERTLTDLRDRVGIGVIVGDVQTDNDARRLRGKGAPVVQITTGGYCHLEASMVAQAADKLDLPDMKLLIIENVGNLVCPATFDLGEDLRVVLLSVTEGEDKPLKYPTIFRNADVVIITKMDLAEAVGLDRKALGQYLQQTAPQACVFDVSARTGVGMEAWYAYLEHFLSQKREVAPKNGAEQIANVFPSPLPPINGGLGGTETDL